MIDSAAAGSHLGNLLQLFFLNLDRQHQRNDPRILGGEAPRRHIRHIAVFIDHRLHPFTGLFGYFGVVMVDHIGNGHRADAGFPGNLFEGHKRAPFYAFYPIITLFLSFCNPAASKYHQKTNFNPPKTQKMPDKSGQSVIMMVVSLSVNLCKSNRKEDAL